MRYLLTIPLLCFVLSAFSQGAPTFSKRHGLYSTAFRLSIKPSVEGREVHYTTDGSTPTLQSPVLRYQTINIAKSTIIRAAEVVEGDSLSAVSTATYLFTADILGQARDENGTPVIPDGYPATWGSFADMKGTAPAFYAMDVEIVTESESKVLKGLKELPIVSVVTDRDNLFSFEQDEERGGIYIYTGAPVGSGIGRDWERPASVELIGGDLKHDVTVDCGIKLHGGHSRLPEKNPKHALRLMFKSKFGASKLHHAVFGDEGVDTFEDLVLRTYFGNAWVHWDEGNRQKAQYTRDLWARSTQERLGWPVSKGQPVHLFLNGMYWGMYNLCERINKDHCAQHFGGKKADWDVIKVEETEGERVVAADGDLEAWNRMQQLVERVGKGSTAAYQELLGLDSQGEPGEGLLPLLDAENFCDYMLINFYGGNTDWDHHNWYAIRNRVNPGRGFQFICWDTELIFVSVNENVVSKDNQGKPSHMLRCLMKNPDFKALFNHRAHVLLQHDGGLLTEAGVRSVWDSLYHQIENALYDESARWGTYRRDVHPYTAKGHRYRVDTYYQNERTRLLTDYFPRRTDIVIQQLRDMGWYSNTDVIELACLPVATDASTTVYDLQGRMLGKLEADGSLPQSLTPGIYIVNGRKVVKR